MKIGSIAVSKKNRWLTRITKQSTPGERWKKQIKVRVEFDWFSSKQEEPCKCERNLYPDISIKQTNNNSNHDNTIHKRI